MTACPFVRAVADGRLDDARAVALAGPEPADVGTIPTLIGMARAHLDALSPSDVCSPRSATWCPVCGSCTCPIDPESGDIFPNDGCPLHDLNSTHGAAR